MPDVFASIIDVPDEMIETIANVLEMRAAIPSQQAMLRDYLSEIQFPTGAKVLEIGCGTGPVCRMLGEWPNVAKVTGIDPSPKLIEKAKELAANSANINFEVGDGKNLEIDDQTFDVVIIHTLLTHVPEPEAVLSEAYRVLKPGGAFGLCDGDFSTATLATAQGDPLESCTAAFVENFVNDKWLVRRMSALASNAGFSVNPIRSYALIETLSPCLTMSWVDRGADVLLAQGRIGEELAVALKSEGRRRAGAGNFFGYMAYAALTATKSA
jgi:ubiquinone/menaquinone biosynthesis C-methylase UbiE